MVNIRNIYVHCLLLFAALTLFPHSGVRAEGNKKDSILALIKNNGKENSSSSLYSQLAKFYSQENNSDSAVYYYEKAYSLAEDSLSENAGEICNETGMLYYRKGDFAKALTFFMKSLEIAKSNGNPSVIARRYGNIGVVYDFLGDYVKSIDYYQKALRLFEANDMKKGMAFIYNNLGVVSEEMDNPKDALNYYKKALRLKLSINDTAGAGSSLNNIGVIFEKYFSDYDSSIYYYKKALNIFKRLNDNRNIATSLNNIGISYRLKKVPDSAVAYTEKALEINSENNYMEGVLSSLFNLGQIYFDKKEYPKAEKNYLQSLSIAQKLNSRKKTAEIYESLAGLYIKINKPAKAYEYQVRFTSLKDSLINEEKSKQIAELKTKYEIEKKDKQLELLSQQNAIQRQRITKYNIVLIAIILIALLISVITILLVKQSKFKTQQKTSELRQKLLRSQMNPHFIFNTLFSIQTYMLENDAISASRFLSRFAKLMRRILENSKHDFVSLENELDFLNQYLFIQQLRFNESFDYEVVFDSDEDPGRILVPPMLSQPFVENAIDHGIRNVEKGGKVKVVFKISGKNLITTISDNGAGFYHKKDKIDENHKSTGIENAKQRIKILTNEYKTDYLFEIRDLTQENGNDSGTIITFAIPLIFD